MKMEEEKYVYIIPYFVKKDTPFLKKAKNFQFLLQIHKRATYIAKKERVFNICG